MRKRAASHAGSWYENNPQTLASQLNGWLEKADFKKAAKALIVPHAGYSYSGPTAAWSYKQIDPNSVRHVFILGPSHRVYFTQCATPVVDCYETPLGNLKLDDEIIQKLQSTGEFREMNVEIDEEEHSIEMQLPYLAHVFKNRLDQVTFVPVLVGSLDIETEKKYSKIFAEYLKRDDTLFVISSDFCHWGRRFDYVRADPSMAIWESIEAMDKAGMDFIEKKDCSGFHDYLNETRNTICGRHPISLFLATLEYSESKNDINTEFKLLHYAQSSKVKAKNDSSVSYVAALCHKA